ncbi:hypothetical protein NDU88_003756 [Pleurodeles waltl]|uniref:Uncharacterized protein n=1 Tax=Pleurodeles waltl TaxID=8319 RepID=A0AAV7N113_PLEWA|nr:hypothetical protein NDU88_003756 [Pleurodeles waltl]
MARCYPCISRWSCWNLKKNVIVSLMCHVFPFPFVYHLVSVRVAYAVRSLWNAGGKESTRDGYDYSVEKADKKADISSSSGSSSLHSRNWLRGWDHIDNPVEEEQGCVHSSGLAYLSAFFERRRCEEVGGVSAQFRDLQLRIHSGI